MAHLDAEELRLEIADRQARLNTPTSKLDAERELRAALAELALIVERLRATLDVPLGVPVSQAAERLHVTTPTVRKWLQEGLLRAVKARKPTEVDPGSVLEVQRVLSRVRESYPSRQWSTALAAYLHDRDIQSQGWAAQGRSELQRGKLIER